jgi:hypothetical protein
MLRLTAVSTIGCTAHFQIPGIGEERYATYISGRQLFYDWEREEALQFNITAIETVGDHPPALTKERTAA